MQTFERSFGVRDRMWVGNIQTFRLSSTEALPQYPSEFFDKFFWESFSVLLIAERVVSEEGFWIGSIGDRRVRDGRGLPIGISDRARVKIFKPSSYARSGLLFIVHGPVFNFAEYRPLLAVSFRDLQGTARYFECLRTPITSISDLEEQWIEKPIRETDEVTP